MKLQMITSPHFVQYTLIHDCPYAVHSDMIPGVISGQYELSECMFDLEAMIHSINGRFVCAKAKSIDWYKNQVMCESMNESELDFLFKEEECINRRMKAAAQRNSVRRSKRYATNSSHISCNTADNDLNSAMSDVMSTCSAVSYSTTMTSTTNHTSNHFGGDQESYMASSLSTPRQSLRSKRRRTTTIPFDVIVVDVDSQCQSIETVPGAQQYAITARPMVQLPSKILAQEQIFFNQVNSGSYTIRYYRIVVVGAGALGVELLCCIAARFDKTFAHLKHLVKFEYTIIDEQESFEQTLGSRRLGRSVRRNVFEAHNNFTSIFDAKPTHVHNNTIDLDNGATIPYDMLVWATGAAPSELLKHADSPLDSKGFLRVNQHLQGWTHSTLFVAGDCASVEEYEDMAKSSVNAIRMGPTLTHNVLKVIQQMWIHHYKTQLAKKPIENGKRSLLQPMSEVFRHLELFKPKSRYLTLLNIGTGSAIGGYLGFSFGPYKWVFSLKNRFDQKLVSSFPQAKIQPIVLSKLAPAS